MELQNSIESKIKPKIISLSLFSDYNKTATNFRLKPTTIHLNKSNKSKTLFLDNKINVNLCNNTMYSNRQNSNNNSINNNELIKTAFKNDKSKTSSIFYHNKRNNLKLLKHNNIFNNKDNVINIINYSKISSIYNSYNNSNRSSHYTTKPPQIKIKIIKKIIINQFTFPLVMT